MSACPSAYYRMDGAKLRAARRMRFLSRDDLAMTSGVSEATIMQIERAPHRYKYGHTRDVVKLLAAALDIEPASLLASEGA